MKARFILLLLAIFVAKFSFGQKVEKINSAEVINQSMVLADSSEFDTALKMLGKVSRSDTNYVKVLIKKAVICRADSQYKEGLKFCEEALLNKSNHEFEADIYTVYGNILLDMENFDEAMKTFDKGIEKFPANSLMYFNKGVVYLRKDKPELAEPLFQETLLMDPYMYSAHYHLGLAAALQGKIIPAYISYMSYLLVSPKGKFASNAINVLQQISVGTDEILELKNKRKVYPNENFQAVEDVLFSKVALNPSYKILSELDDPISRQIQAVIEKVEYSNEDSDFWVQYYLPLFKKTYESKKLDILVYHMFSNVNLPNIEAYLSKHKKQVEAYITEAGSYFNLIQATRTLNLKDRDTVSSRYHFEDGILLGKSGLSKTGKALLGPWTGYYPSGSTKNIGQYDNLGQRTGQFKWFNFKGEIHAIENYLNGKLEGKQEYFYDNGNLSSVEQYVNGRLDGLSTGYGYGGYVKVTINYKDGKKNGEEKNFYANGRVSAINNYTVGVVNGYKKTFFKDGKLKSELKYVNGKAEGIFKEFNSDGILVSEGSYVNDAANGNWKYYYNDGKIKQSFIMLSGVEQGLNQEYYTNGQVSKTANVVKDKMQGEVLEYYSNGKVLSNQTYVNGILVKANYLDKAGKILGSYNNANENNRLTVFDNTGFKKASFSYNKAGELNGLDTIFYSSGNVNYISNYKNGTLDGRIFTYYQNGKIKSEGTLVDGKSEGYYKNYFMNGNVEAEGWFVADERQGTWLYYNANGSLSFSQYFLDGVLDGYKEEYHGNGQKSVDYRYHEGTLEEVTHYGIGGKIIANDVLAKGQGKFRLLYPDGKLMAESNFKNGEFDGVFKTYYFDGSAERTFFHDAGKLDSTFLYFQHGGLKSIEGKYLDGEKYGNWKYYDEDGKLYRNLNYSRDMLNGPFTTYHSNGNKSLTAYTQDNLFQGNAITYDSKGNLAYQILYNEDLATAYSFNDGAGKLKDEVNIESKKGVLKAFYGNGKPSRICYYTGGERDGSDKIYYENGMLKSEEQLELNVLQGPSKSYFENGKLEEESNYLNDNFHGLRKLYNENGTIKRETNYENDVIHGTVKIYNGQGKLIQTKTFEYGVLKSVKDE